MAGRRAIKAINWAGLAERVNEADKTAFAAFKAKTDQYVRNVQSLPETQPKIDWSYYKSKISTPGLVDKFQKEYEALKVDYPVDKYTSLIEAKEKEADVYIKQFIDESNKRIAESQAEIKKLESLLAYGQMTMEDFAEAHPDIALDPINRPSIWPHTPEVQPDEEGAEKKEQH